MKEEGKKKYLKRMAKLKKSKRAVGKSRQGRKEN